jgi:hypothetical protein
MNQKKIIVSASRRTDIPAFYMPWFMECVIKKRFVLKNPRSKKISTLVFTPENIAAVYFWSKDYELFLNNNYGEKLEDMGFPVFFHYTLNSFDPVLEPGIKKSTKQRCDILDKLALKFGPERIFLRFDPVVFYKDENNVAKNNLHDFEYIAQSASKAGIKKMIISFADLYKKVVKREIKHKITFINPEDSKKVRIIQRMKNVAEKLNIELNLCCETIEGPGSLILNKPCISPDHVNKVLNLNLKQIKDRAQRNDCICSQSRDIGSYDDHPCFHNCTYCYARPQA